jgi:hypothetical protein
VRSGIQRCKDKLEAKKVMNLGSQPVGEKASMVRSMNLMARYPLPKPKPAHITAAAIKAAQGGTHGPGIAQKSRG